MGILDELIPELVHSRHAVESDMYDDQKALIVVALDREGKTGLF